MGGVMSALPAMLRIGFLAYPIVTTIAGRSFPSNLLHSFKNITIT